MGEIEILHAAGRADEERMLEKLYSRRATWKLRKSFAKILSFIRKPPRSICITLEVYTPDGRPAVRMSFGG